MAASGWIGIIHTYIQTYIQRQHNNIYNAVKIVKLKRTKKNIAVIVMVTVLNSYIQNVITEII